VDPLSKKAGEPRGGHGWLGVVGGRPSGPVAWARWLDEALATLNTDYRTKRSGSVGMVAPIVTALAAGTFHRWMRKAARLGDQHKVARVTNDRTIANALLVEGAGHFGQASPDGHRLATPLR
jgi:hypothetical protein